MKDQEYERCLGRVNSGFGEKEGTRNYESSFDKNGHLKCFKAFF